jgi:hypothetical protein
MYSFKGSWGVLHNVSLLLCWMIIFVSVLWRIEEVAFMRKAFDEKLNDKLLMSFLCDMYVYVY